MITLPTQDDLPYDDVPPDQWPRIVLPTQDDLPYEDGIPMESERHRVQMELLINPLRPWLAARPGGGYVSGDMFVYFSKAQVRNQSFRGPDVFVVLDAEPYMRKSRVVWEEGKGPDIVIELLSSATAREDKTGKKTVYQNQLKVSEYFWFDPWNSEDWAGFELVHGRYRPIPPDTDNRLYSPCLDLKLVRWHGTHAGEECVWLRWATPQGVLLPTAEEETDQARREADTAARRAAEAEAEVERLRALLREQES